MPTPLKNRLPAITVYCGSSAGVRPIYQEEAIRLGQILAQEGIRMIYGGGQKGLMGQVADSCLQAGGEVIGIIPHFMIEREWAHTGVTELKEVETMSERKEQMLALGSGSIALPGGLGTLEEFSEVLSWSQLLIHRKPVGILNTAHYYDHFLDFFRHMVKEGFVSQETSDLLIVDESPEALLQKMADFHHNGDGVK